MTIDNLLAFYLYHKQEHYKYELTPDQIRLWIEEFRSKPARLIFLELQKEYACLRDLVGPPT